MNRRGPNLTPPIPDFLQVGRGPAGLDQAFGLQDAVTVRAARAGRPALKLMPGHSVFAVLAVASFGPLQSHFP